MVRTVMVGKGQWLLVIVLNWGLGRSIEAWYQGKVLMQVGKCPECQLGTPRRVARANG